MDDIFSLIAMVDAMSEPHKKPVMVEALEPDDSELVLSSTILNAYVESVQGE